MSTAKNMRAPERIQPPPFWTAKQVAAYLGMSESWVYAQAVAGKMPCRKLGGAVRFDPEEIQRWAKGEQVEIRRVCVITPIRDPQ